MLEISIWQNSKKISRQFRDIESKVTKMGFSRIIRLLFATKVVDEGYFEFCGEHYYVKNWSYKFFP